MIDADSQTDRLEVPDGFVVQLTEFENSIPWMYLDTHAHVTVGVGYKLPTAASAQALDFLDRSGVSATPADILRNFQHVSEEEPGLSPNAYRSWSSVLLPDATINSLLMLRVKECDNHLAAKFRFSYYGFPDPAKLALLDMLFNLGPRGLFWGFPELMTDVQHVAWAEAARHCHRKGVSPERNAWTVAEFEAAAPLQRPKGPELRDGWDGDASKGAESVQETAPKIIVDPKPVPV